jgi:hypothetical protein
MEMRTMKKLVIFSGLAVILLGIILVVFGIPCLHHSTERNVTHSFPQSIGSGGHYVLATSYSVVNGLYPTYKTVPPDIGDYEVERLKNLFGLSENAKETKISNKIFDITDESKEPAAALTLFPNSGTFVYNIPEKYYPYSTDVQIDLPSDEESHVIAIKYLSERNLLPDDVHFKEISIGSQYGEYTPTSHTIYNLTKDVRFVKEIQGIAVYNAGITVTIGDHGDVVGVTNSLRDLEPDPFRMIKIITPEQAYQRLLSNNLVIAPLSEDYNEIIITDITLGYWMEIPTHIQKYVLPVYAFSCIGVREDNREQIMRYVSAVEPSEMHYFS